jgi:membrane protein DedA with SNARE-associated domain
MPDFEALVGQFGYLAVLIGTFFEGETVVLVAGALAQQGSLALPLVILTAFIGTTLGDMTWFFAGRRAGMAFFKGRPTWEARARKVEDFLQRRGDLFVLGFRFLYGIRTVAPATLGAIGYDPKKYLALNAIGAAIWSVAFGLIGWGAGKGFETAMGRGLHVQISVVVILSIIGLVVLIRWLRRTREPDPALPPVEPLAAVSAEEPVIGDKGPSPTASHEPGA